MMKPERWQQIDRLWDEILDRPQNDRAAFIDQVCQGDESLRQELVSLLELSEEAASFIETPAMEQTAALLAVTSVQSLTNRSFGRYEIQKFIGAGGMGEVYLARDTQLNRPIAIKLLPIEFAESEKSLLGFEREARTISSLNHPNIITIHEVGEAEGWRFIATEFVDGLVLRRRLADGPVQLDEALNITIQIAAALSAAHEAGVVHNDIKPENVMIRKDGYVKILDFGIAKLTGSHTNIPVTLVRNADVSPSTKQSSVIGTLPYMSPEQARGLEVDGRTDIWSLGVVFYELLTGNLPFNGSSKAEVLSAILEKDFPPLPPQSAPEQLESALDRALRKDRSERYQTAQELASDLQQIRQRLDYQTRFREEAVVADRASRGRSNGVDGIRNRYIWAAMVCVLLLAATSFFIYRYAPVRSVNNSSGTQTHSLKPVLFTSYSGTETAPAISPDGKYIAFSWNGVNEDNYDIYVKPIGSDDAPLRLTTDPGEDTIPTWSPDGLYIAFARGGSDLFLIEAKGGGERKIGRTSGGRISFHPSGMLLATTFREAENSPKYIELLDIETGRKRRLTAPPEDSFGDFFAVFSPDGRTMAFCRYSSSAVNDIFITPFDLGGEGEAGEPQRLTADARLIQGLAWTEDGSTILFSSNRDNNRGLWRIPVRGGEIVRVPVPAENPAWPSTSRHGSLLAYEQRTVDTNIWLLKSPHSKGAFPSALKLIASSKGDFSPQYSPDGKLIVFRSDRSGHEEIWRCDADGSHQLQLTKMEGPLTGSPKFSPDGKWIVFDSRPDNQADLFIVGIDGENMRRLTETEATEVVPSWSADGRFIYYGSSRSGEFQIYQIPAEGGGEARQITQNGGFAPIASFDGQYIFYSKGRDKAGIWKVPVGGGEEVPIIVESPKAWLWGYWAVTERGIYYVQTSDQALPSGTSLDFYEFSNEKALKITALERPPVAGDSGLGVSPDESSFLYTTIDYDGHDIVLVEGYH